MLVKQALRLTIYYKKSNSFEEHCATRTCFCHTWDVQFLYKLEVSRWRTVRRSTLIERKIDKDVTLSDALRSSIATLSVDLINIIFRCEHSIINCTRVLCMWKSLLLFYDRLLIHMHNIMCVCKENWLNQFDPIGEGPNRWYVIFNIFLFCFALLLTRWMCII